MNRILFLRQRLGMNQYDFAEYCDISRASVARYDAGSKVDRKNAQKIAAACRVSVDYVLGLGPDYPEAENISIVKKAVPIIGEIACGSPISAEQGFLGYTDMPEGVHADFALVCKGDSMEPIIKNGDIVLVRKQPDVEDGQVGVVNIDGEATLKHVYHQKDGLLLVANNPKFAPIVTDERIIIQGLAVGFVRIFS